MRSLCSKLLMIVTMGYPVAMEEGKKYLVSYHVSGRFMEVM